MPELSLIAVGAGLRSCECDRPIQPALRQRIEALLDLSRCTMISAICRPRSLPAGRFVGALRSSRGAQSVLFGVHCGSDSLQWRHDTTFTHPPSAILAFCGLQCFHNLRWGCG
jgi:hypothetical protein